MEEKEENILTEKDRFSVYSTIHIYEMSLGFIVGILVNELSFNILPLKQNETLLTTILTIIVARLL